MRKILAISLTFSVLFFFSPFHVQAATIAFDSETDASNSGASSLTFSHTVAGTNTILFVSVFTQSGSDTVTSVTFNGVSGTEINSIPSATLDLWCVAAPAATTANVVISRSDTTGVIIGWADSYTGAQQTCTPDAKTTNTVTSATSVTATLTTISDNAWIVGGFRNTSGTFSAGSNTTLRGTPGSTAIGDTNAAQTPAGSHSIAATWTGSATGYVVAASFAPAATATTASVLAAILSGGWWK